ncbi:MAG: hypothetical protein QMC26_14725, partial [Pseudomonadales bacterium]
PSTPQPLNPSTLFATPDDASQLQKVTNPSITKGYSTLPFGIKELGFTQYRWSRECRDKHRVKKSSSDLDVYTNILLIFTFGLMIHVVFYEQ